VLDEPTNNLDLASLDQLIDALSSYRGGLLIVSHDDAFLKRLGITTTVQLTPEGDLSDAPA
jgi:ATPase subunit of ABC transporter with duplicated ATPase domains